MNLPLEINNTEQLANICGSFDQHLDTIANSLDVNISNKDWSFSITGDNQHIAARVLQNLVYLSKDNAIVMHEVGIDIKTHTHNNLSDKVVHIKTKRKLIHVRSKNQQNYVNVIKDKDCTFGIGPADTGKTYLAVARMVEVLERSDVRRLVLVRHAVEAGENWGFCLSDMNEKFDPHLRPIYDAL